MQTVADVLRRAATAGVALLADPEAGMIALSPPGRADAQLRAAVQAHKPVLLRILPSQAPDPTAHAPPRT